VPSTHLTAAEIDTLLKDAREGTNSIANVIPRGDKNHWLMLVLQADTVNPPEMHAHEVDIYIAVEGAAQLTLDGELEGAEEVSPGQFKGGRIVGGRTVALAAGDVVHIPAQVPHQLTTRGTTYKQFVVKMDVS